VFGCRTSSGSADTPTHHLVPKRQLVAPTPVAWKQYFATVGANRLRLKCENLAELLGALSLCVSALVHDQLCDPEMTLYHFGIHLKLHATQHRANPSLTIRFLHRFVFPNQP
jgi:hypothetical protein